MELERQISVILEDRWNLVGRGKKNDRRERILLLVEKIRLVRA